MNKINAIEQVTFYNTHKKLSCFIVSNILKGVGSKEDVEECVNDIMLEIIKKYDRYDANKSSIKNYVSILSRSRALNYRKKLQKNKTVLFTDDILVKDTNSDYMRDILEKVIKMLNYSEKQLFKYKYVYEYANADIAKAMKLTEGYTRIKVHRLKKKLIKLLKKHGIEGWEV
ncbi:sigma-70 family RNA polymerase sigma factor [Vallitalea pronyensis]|uniref:Sigma-70 family RNA polymerase sigma factor n=1 Tax=Vallitalea pronyensis TaxID=1348613 RepID=A0A8J8MHX8_9FIRM|nr:sigma-70 family RNA polymerase sigma factor [Vallitalea pronyensis]QUI21766.1 sigma-70 family RNA polymerase sigma factor [Vallitalea pronyensis]